MKYAEDRRAWKNLTQDESSRKKYQEKLMKADTDIRSLLEIDAAKGFSLAAPDTATKLSGIPFSVKDNIAVSGFKFTCASRILEHLVSPYTATAVQHLLDAGAVPIGKSNLDEFGMGSSTENSYFRNTCNPWDLARVPGGSSGGSAASVAAGLVPFSLGSDTGGSVRQPAAFCGIYGLKPTYGRVSRYGLAAYASSFETIGILTCDIDMLSDVFEVVQGIDPMDQTTRPGSPLPEPLHRAPAAAVLTDLDGLDPSVRRGYDRTVEAMRSLGWNIVEVSLPSHAYAVPAYYTIAMAEASANLARYTGVRYGTRSLHGSTQEEMIRRTRDEGFGSEVKLRILLGTYVLRAGFQDQYYTKAQKIRTLISREFKGVFRSADALLLPVFPVQAFKIGETGMTPMQQKIADRYTLTANLAGIPALSFPSGTEGGLPVGMQLLGPSFSDEKLICLVGELMKALPGSKLPIRFTPEEVLHD